MNSHIMRGAGETVTVASGERTGLVNPIIIEGNATIFSGTGDVSYSSARIKKW